MRKKQNQASLNEAITILDFLKGHDLLDNYKKNYELFFLLSNSKLNESRKNEAFLTFNNYCEIKNPLIKDVSINEKINKEIQSLLIKTDNIYEFTSEIFGLCSKRFTKYCASQLKYLDNISQNKLLLARFGRLLELNADFIFYKISTFSGNHFIFKHSFEHLLNKLLFLISFYNESKKKILYMHFIQLESLIEYPIIDCYNKLHSLSHNHLLDVKSRVNKNVKNISDIIDDLTVLANQCDSHLIKFEQDMISSLDNQEFSDFVIKVPKNNIELYELGHKMANCLRNKNNDYVNQISKKDSYLIYLEGNNKIYCITFSYNMKNLKFLEFKGVYNENVPAIIISEFFKYLDNYLMLK